MPFNIPHYGTISGPTGHEYPSITVIYVFGDSEDHGAQFAEGLPENLGAILISDRQEVDRDYDGTTSYAFRLTNMGSNATSYGVAGGGPSFQKYTIPHYGTIGGQSSIKVGHVFGSGEDHGQQFTEGLPENPGAFLLSENHEISSDNTGAISYAFDLTNGGGNATSFGLAGGAISGGFRQPNYGTIAQHHFYGPRITVAYSLDADRSPQLAQGIPEDPGASLTSGEEGIERDDNGAITHRFELFNGGFATTFSLAVGDQFG